MFYVVSAWYPGLQGKSQTNHRWKGCICRDAKHFKLVNNVIKIHQLKLQKPAQQTQILEMSFYGAKNLQVRPLTQAPGEATTFEPTKEATGQADPTTDTQTLLAAEPT